MIWGMTLEPGQAQTEVIVGEIQLSMATMESRGCLGAKSDSFSHVVMRTSTAEYLLCTLVSGVTYQQNLDLKLMPNDKVTFSVQGTNVVYLTGYSYMPSEVMMDEAEAGVQADDWIEEANLDASVPRDDSGDFSGMDASYFPAMNQEDRHPHEREDEEKYSVEYSEDRDQYQPETDERVQTSDSSGNMMDRSLTSESKQTTQEPIDNAGVELVDVKEEIHTIADTTEDEPTQQIEREDRGQTINLPSTSTVLLQPQPLSKQKPGLLQLISHSEMFHRGQADDVHPFNSSLTLRNNLPPRNLAGVDHHVQGQDGFSLQSEYSYANRVASKLYLQKRIETQSAKFACRICQKPFDDYQTKMNHEVSHKCRYCRKEFLQIKHKEHHEMIHGRDRPHKCRFCGNGFRDQTTRAQHERIHTGEKPFKCRYCEMRFPHRESKRRHERKHIIAPS
ncbi:uncharacterized protein [Apostichopus japonicus]|uniref:uncharacterized protein isoform X4 n=1 Tax=Stichopus japonicus TaxID=307972 RepID=UPI003AB16DAB